VKEHKVLCRMITNKFKHLINKNKEEKPNITIPNTNHELIASFDVGLQLYPVTPGTNFVLNGPETKTLVNNYLARTTLDETLYESTTQLLKPPNIDTTEGDQWDSDDEDDHWDWKSHTCDYDDQLSTSTMQNTSVRKKQITGLRKMVHPKIIHSWIHRETSKKDKNTHSNSAKIPG